MSPNARGYLIAFVATVGLAVAVTLTMKKQKAASPQDAAAPMLTPSACSALANAYERALSNACASDSDCVVEARGALYGELDDCFRVMNRSSKSEADRLASAWVHGGCSHDYPSCGSPPPVACRAGNCTERPPAPIPEDWQRAGSRSFFTMFIPPDMVRQPPYPDGIIFVWHGGGRHLQVYEGGLPARETWEKEVSATKSAIDGRTVTLHRLRAYERAAVDTSIEGVAAPFWATLLEHNTRRMTLSIRLDCDREDLCDVASIILGSLEILSD